MLNYINLENKYMLIKDQAIILFAYPSEMNIWSKNPQIGSVILTVMSLYFIYYITFGNPQPFYLAVRKFSLQLPDTAKNPTEQVIKESKLAHKLLDGLKGIEIGASLHNPFGLDTLNIDNNADPNAKFQMDQINRSDHAAKVHIVASGDQLPFTNDSIDFVVNSHLLEHFYDPIKVIQEWLRVVKPGGYVYMDISHKERTNDAWKNRTTLAELLERHARAPTPEQLAFRGHQSNWITEDILELCRHFNWTVAEWRDMDDKDGKSFTIVLRKSKES